MTNISNLYPQYKPSEDRRKNNIPVAIERRSGKDRRAEDRVALDSRLTRDIWQVKGQIAKLETFTPKFLEHVNITQNSEFASKNNLTRDEFVKPIKPDMSEILREEAKLQQKADTSFKIGMVAAALAGAIAVSFMGTAGAVIAVGATLYVGSRVLKNVMVKELKDEDNKSI